MRNGYSVIYNYVGFLQQRTIDVRPLYTHPLVLYRWWMNTDKTKPSREYTCSSQCYLLLNVFPSSESSCSKSVPLHQYLITLLVGIFNCGALEEGNRWPILIAYTVEDLFSETKNMCTAVLLKPKKNIGKSPVKSTF
jgi:hypothetical protein